MSKDKYKVKNWKIYNEGLKQRGALTLWIPPDLNEQWKYKGKASRGGQYQYSQVAIEFCLMIHKAFHLPLRQTEGFVQSVFEMQHWHLAIPDYTTLCRRQAKMEPQLQCWPQTDTKDIDIAVDSTGLKVYGEGEWKVRKHGAGKHRTWMKLHVAVEEHTQQLQAATLSTNAEDDASEVKALLDQLPKGRVRSFKADGAYDKKKVRKLLYEEEIKQVIPPQHNAVKSKREVDYLGQRDAAIAMIAQSDRKQWKIQSGYHGRSKSETVMFRYKTIVGEHLTSRKEAQQQCEVIIGCKILNIMLATAKPVSIRAA